MSYHVECTIPWNNAWYSRINEADRVSAVGSLAGQPPTTFTPLIGIDTHWDQYVWIVPNIETAREIVESLGGFDATFREDINPDDERHDPDPTIYGV